MCHCTDTDEHESKYVDDEGDAVTILGEWLLENSSLEVCCIERTNDGWIVHYDEPEDEEADGDFEDEDE